MSEYNVNLQVRRAHQAYINSAQWGMVNTMGSDYPDLCAIKDKYPTISVGEANAMINRNRLTQRLSKTDSQAEGSQNAKVNPQESEHSK